MRTLHHRLFGIKHPIVYEVFENPLLFHDLHGYQTIKIMHENDNMDAIIRELQMSAVDAVYTDVTDPDFIQAVLEMGIVLYSLNPVEGAEKVRQFGRDVYLKGGTDRSMAAETIKWILDKIGAVVGSLICVILFFIFAPIIKMESKGPVIFKQDRVGLNGRRFIVYKFRTMQADAEQMKDKLKEQMNDMDKEMFKLEKDIRITKFGQWLRERSLDEFPQFWNVLKGDMSLVGTRPPTLDEVKVYLPHHKKRLSARPGITGMWQISGRNKLKDFEQIVKLDVSYIENKGIKKYIYILLRTVGSMKEKEGM